MFTEPKIQDIKIDSVISPKQIAKLYFKPKAFFLMFAKLDMQYIHFATYIVAVFFVMDRIDTKLVKALASDHPNYSSYSFILDHWLNYWICVLALGAVASFITWFFYGWWYEIRLKWCGVENPDTALVRQANIMQWFVAAFPVIVITVIQTFIYDNYLDTFFSEEIWSGLIILFFSIYSCWVSYVAAKILFLANKRAILWFLALPLVFYSFVVIAMFSMFAGS
ncbi:hypothetical protein F935_01743 [Acinetobacter calcoaceticus ANC 3811]|uniref:Yip1 domain-containing protein n=1 Tax=Acinetobacter calcoaceticus ANC 3811 TaxID=1217690 RepID=R8Y0C7_ACICA|nr:hypothetical protein [Acinetobacter calcoaceticus]EOQ62654.1 hypothetical protein F935_01743 [Acinetobacter calcoaceticus ANC 3811]